MIRRPPRSTRTDTLFPYTTRFRSVGGGDGGELPYPALPPMRIDVRLPPVLGGGALRVLRRRVRRRRGRLRPFGRPRRRRRKGREGGADREGVGDPPRPPPPGPGGKIGRAHV